MAVVETLAKGVIELGIDDIKLKDEVRGGTRVIADGLKQALNSTRLTSDHMQKLYAITRNIAYLDTSRVKLQDQVTRKTKEQVQNVKQTVAETQKYAQIRRQLGLDGSGKTRDWGAISDRTGSALSFAGMAGGSVAGTATGLTFAAAAAAGTTTIDTLTGSLKMLSLAAGAKTQSSVMSISKAIQNLAKVVEKAEPGTIGGTVGAASGAGLGAKIGSFFGPLGTIAGMTLGGIGGGIAGWSLEKNMNQQSQIEAIANTMITGGKTKDAWLKDQAELMKMPRPPALSSEEDANKWRKAMERAQNISSAIKLAESPEAKDLKEKLKTAGLGMPGSFSGLADLRQQAQLSVFAPGGELGAANAAKELENNQKAMQPVVEEIKGLRQDFKQNGVMPPANAN